MPSPQPYVSVVIPVYNEAANLQPLFDRLMPVLDTLGKPFEVLLPTMAAATARATS